MNHESFTAVIDSGIGGISVLAEARRQMPAENFLFFADAGNAPYGDKPTETIQKLMQEHADAFVNAGAKAILIACNTATSAAAAVLRKTLTIPVLGVEPALKPAALNEDGQILVLGTRLTIREKKFQDLLKTYGEGRDIIPIACPGLMQRIETDPMGAETAAYLDDVFKPYRSTMKAVVLGCTHYVFLRPLLRSRYPELTLYDGNEGVCRHLKQVLTENQLTGGTGKTLWDCSLPEPEKSRYIEKCRRFLAVSSQ